MSVVDDLRKLLQDLVTPDVRALTVKVEHVEAGLHNLAGKVEKLDQALADMRGEMRAQAETLISQVRAEVRSGVAQIAEKMRLDQRIAALEEERSRKELS
jgi:hypothetical protein